MCTHHAHNLYMCTLRVHDCEYVPIIAWGGNVGQCRPVLPGLESVSCGWMLNLTWAGAAAMYICTYVCMCVHSLVCMCDQKSLQ